MYYDQINSNCICRPWNLESFPVNIFDYLKKNQIFKILHTTNTLNLKMEFYLDKEDRSQHLFWKFSKIFCKNENDYISTGKVQINNENFILFFKSEKENISLLRPAFEKIYKKCLNHFMFVDGLLQINEDGEIIIPKLFYNLNIFDFDFVSEVFKNGKILSAVCETENTDLFFYGEHKENSYTITLKSGAKEPIKIKSEFSFPYPDTNAMILTRHEIIIEALEILLLKFHKTYFSDKFFTIPERKTDDFREIEFNLVEAITDKRICNKENDEFRDFDKKWSAIHNG